MGSDDEGGMARAGPAPEPGNERTPFERFEDVLRKVVTVPKSAVDEKRRLRKAE